MSGNGPRPVGTEGGFLAGAHRTNAVVLAAALAGALCAQDITMGRVSFEVASIKPTADAGNHRPVRFAVSAAGQLTVANMPLRWLIANAWGVPFQSKRLTGGPGWVNSEPYDIQAVAPAMFAPGISAKEREARTRVMLRALLAQRFGLVVREEAKELPVYGLVQTKGGHKLRPAVIQENDCPVNPPDDGLYCHHLDGGMRDGLRGQAVDMNDVAQQAEDWLDRPVLDQTGIAGLYNVRTEGWGAPEDTEKPSVFRVFEDTLGLKLEPKKATVKIYVIEKVDRPSPN